MKGSRFISEYKISLKNKTPLKIGNGKDEMDILDGECKYTDLIMQGDKYLEDKKYEDALDKYTLALDEESGWKVIKQVLLEQNK